MKNIMEALTKLQNPSICRDGRICQRETHSYCSINHELMAQWPNGSSSWVKGIDCSKLIKQPHTELAEHFHRMRFDQHVSEYIIWVMESSRQTFASWIKCLWCWFSLHWVALLNHVLALAITLLKLDRGGKNSWRVAAVNLLQAEDSQKNLTQQPPSLDNQFKRKW